MIFAEVLQLRDYKTKIQKKKFQVAYVEVMFPLGVVLK